MRGCERGRRPQGWGVLFAALCWSTAASSATHHAGATLGQFEVDSNGAATYTIPLKVPPGAGGLQPELSLVYNSQQGNGLLGVGWSLGGLSAITRCPATKAIDGFIDPVDFDDNDKFCLDGQRLIAVSGAYGADGTEYRTEKETYSKIVSYGVAGGGPREFRVWTKSGLTMIYGTAGALTMNASGRDDIINWNLTEVKDSSENSIQFLYDHTNPREIRISQIHHGFDPGGSNPKSVVTFGYESRPDISVTYIAGSDVRLVSRLNVITVYTNSTVASQYRVGYVQDADGLSRISAIAECAADGVCKPSSTFVNTGSSPATFQDYYLGSTSGITDPSWTGEKVVASGDFNGDGLLDLYLMHVDQYGRSTGNVYDHVWLSRGDGTFVDIGQGSASGITDGGWLGYAVAGIGDFNGDGLTDLYLMHVDQYGRSTGVIYDHVWLARGDGTFTDVSLSNFSGINDPSWSGYKVSGSGDFNGDGYTDLYLMQVDEYGRSNGSEHDHVWLSNGYGHFNDVYLGGSSGIGGAAWVEYKIAGSGDFNGDGLTDLYLAMVDQFGRANGSPYDHVWLSQGDGTFRNVSQGSTSGIRDGSWTGYRLSGTGDFNGDGLTDFYWMHTDQSGRSTGTVFDNVWLSKGDGTFQNVGLGSASGITDTTWNRYSVAGSGDFNGDGLTDLYLLSTDEYGRSDGGVWDHVWLSKGDGTFRDVGQGTVSGINHPSWATYGVAGIGDLDGDGLTDLYLMPTDQYGRSSGGNSDHIWHAKGDIARLSSITDGLGDQIDITYKPLTETSVYTKQNDAIYPTRDIQAPIYVVSQYSQSDGLGGDYTFTYRYEGAKSHVDRGFLGFRKMTVTDSRTGLVNTTVYNQTYPTQGMPESSETYTGTGTLIERSVNTWQSSSPDGKRQVVELASSDQTRYELSGALITRTTTSNTYDSYGNVTQVTVDHNDGHSKTTTNTYTNDTAKWHLGRLTRAQVTSTAPGGYSATRTSAFEYDPTTGLLTKEIVEPDTPALRLETAYQYDAFGNKTVVTVSGADIATRTTTTQYDASGTFPIQVTNAAGHTETRTFEARWGVMTSLTGPNGLTTTWDYDSLGRKIAEHRADGTSTTITYTLCESACAFGAPLIITKQDSGSVPKTVYFDALGREVMSETVGFDGRTIYKKTEYDAYGRVARISRPYFSGETPYWTSYQYDVLGRMTYETNPDGSYTDVAYAGLTKTTTNDLAQSFVETKDSQGQVVQVTDADNNSSHYTYDAFGNLVQTTDALGNITTMSYDLRGRKTAMNDPDMGAWSYRYDALGQLTWQQDAKGQVVTMAYDKLGRMVQRSEAEGLSQWTYDTAAKGIGKPAQVTGPGGYVRSHSYDSLGRPSSTTTTIAGSVYTESVAYDLYSRVQTKTYPTGFGVKNVYNSGGYLSEIRNAANDSLYWQANYVDASGNIGEETLGNGLSTVRTFDADSGRLTAIVTGATGQVQLLSYQYDTLGNLRQRRDDNQGLTEDFNYDNLNRLVSAAIVGGSTKTYQYDAIGNLTYKSDVGNYTYGQNGAGPHAVTQAGSNTYTYDANGNQISGDGRGIVYTSFNKPLQITKGNTVNDYQYGADHQRIVKTSQVGTGNSGATEVIVDNTDPNTSQVGTWAVSSAPNPYGTNSVYRDTAGSFRWTPDLPAQGSYKVYARWTYHTNRTTQVPYRVTHSGGTAEIIVNQKDQSLAGQWVLLGTYEFAAGSAGYVEVSSENGQANADAVKFVKVDSANTGTTITHYLGKAYERVQKPSGVIEHKHYLSAGGTTILYTERSNAANDTRYLHKDHLGSTDVITDEQGQVVERLSFDAWGARRNSNWTTAPNYGFDLVSLVTRGFTGHEQDDGVGLINMNARLYDAKLGRFLQPDTFVQHPYTTQGMNRYTYVNNNPLSFTDPTGHFLKKLFKGVKKLFKNKIFRAVVAVVAAYFTAGLVYAAYGPQIAGSVWMAGGGAGLASAAASGVAGMAGGFVGGLIASGGDLRAAFIGAFSGGMAGVIGGFMGHSSWSVEKVLAHGVSGGVAHEMAGGEFRQGFAAGAFSSALSPLTSIPRHPVGKLVASAVVGGTASRLAGGKFANGAATATFIRLFNDGLAPGSQSKLSKRDSILVGRAAKTMHGRISALSDDQMRETFAELARVPNDIGGALQIDASRHLMLNDLEAYFIGSLENVLAKGQLTVIDTAVSGIVLAPFKTLSNMSSIVTIGGEVRSLLPINDPRVHIGCHAYQGCRAVIER